MKGFLNLEPQYSIEIVVTSHVCVYFFSLKIQKDSKLSSADFKLEFSKLRCARRPQEPWPMTKLYFSHKRCDYSITFFCLSCIFSAKHEHVQEIHFLKKVASADTWSSTGVCHEIFYLDFFHDSNPSGPKTNRLKYFRIIFRFHRYIGSLSTSLSGLQHPIS